MKTSNIHTSDHHSAQNPDIRQMDEEALVRRVVADPSDVWREELYRRIAPLVYQRALAIVRQPEVAEDLAHDIIIKILLKIGSFSFRSSFRHWVYRVTYNHCINYLKRYRKEHAVDWSAPGTVLTAEDRSVALEREQRLHRLERAMQYLTEEERALLWMRYKDDIPVAEMAELYHIGESAMKMRLKRLRDRLAKIYNALEDEEEGF